MKRRTYLLGTVALSAAVAGCGGTDTDDVPVDEDADTNDVHADADDATPEPDDDAGDDADADDGGDPDPADAPQGEDVLEYEGLVILEHELVEPDDDFGFPEVVGIVENTRDEPVDYVEVGVRVYDHDGHMIESWFTNTTDLQAGGTWRFEVMINEDYEDIAEYDIRITDSPF